MAKAKEPKAVVDKTAKPSVMSVALPVLLLTLIAAGGGFAVAKLSVPGPEVAHGDPPAEPASVEVPNAEQGKSAAGDHGGEPAATAGIVRQLAPIITNLATPKDIWMRIEVAIVIAPEAKAEQDLIAVESSSQLLGFLRTIDLAQIEGPSGFLHFKEDINDLLRESSKNKVTQVLVNSLVVE